MSLSDIFNFGGNTGFDVGQVSSIVEGVKFGIVEPLKDVTKSLLVSTENLDTRPHQLGMQAVINFASICGREPKSRIPPLSEIVSLSDLYAAYAVYPMRLDLAFLVLCAIPFSSLSRKRYIRNGFKIAGITLMLTLVFPQQTLFLLHLAVAKSQGSLKPMAPSEMPVVTQAKNLVDSFPSLNQPVAPRSDNSSTHLLTAAILGCGLAGALLFSPKSI